MIDIGTVGDILTFSLLQFQLSRLFVCLGYHVAKCKPIDE